MELRHLRYFIAVAEEGSLTVAAEKRLFTAQPSLSRQIRDLEIDLGVTLLVRGARGIELTAAGKVFLDHARMVLLMVETGREATRRAARPPKTSFTLGFLTGHEMDWLPTVIALLQERPPGTEIVIQSRSSPELATALARGEVDVAILRREIVEGLDYRLLREEPLIVIAPSGHRFADQVSVQVADLAGETIVGVPMATSPVLRKVIDAYAERVGVDLSPDHIADNLSMTFSLVASTNGVSLLPLYARNLLPATVVGRPLSGAVPMIELAIGYSRSNASPLLKFLLSKTEEIKFQVGRTNPPSAR